MPNFTNFRFQDLTEYSNGIEMHKATNLVYKHKQKTLCLPATHRSVGLIVQEGEVVLGPRKGRSQMYREEAGTEACTKPTKRSIAVVDDLKL